MPNDIPMNNAGPGVSPFLEELFRYASGQTGSTAATGNASNPSGEQRRMNFNTRIRNMTFSFGSNQDQYGGVR